MRKLLLTTLCVLAYATTYGQNIYTIAGGLGDGGPAINTPLKYPKCTVVDSSGNIYIADQNNNRIRKVTVSTGIISTVAGNGIAGYAGDGSLAISANLNSPSGLSIDGSGNIYIADYYNNRIRKVTASTGIITTVAGNGIAAYGGDSSAATSSKLNSPTGIAIDGSGNIYIADQSNHRIRKVTASTGIISTVAGNGTAAYAGDGSAATLANLSSPTGVTVDVLGNIYIADNGNHRIRKVTASTGIISTIAGNGTAAYGGDSSAATLANLSSPTGVTVDGLGNIYIADLINKRIRKVTASTGIISTVAGNGIAAYGGDGSPATLANLYYPVGVAVDGLGNIYIADNFNQRIRKITVSTGIISTVAGNGTDGFGGDGNIAISSILYNPRGISVDGSGNIYIADRGNHRIRKVSALTGIISTVAGNGTAAYGGDGNSATSANLNGPSGLAIDGSGNIYIADYNNHRIRKVTASTGIISTLAGNGTGGYGGDGNLASLANLNHPLGVAVDDFGNIYIADRDNHRIRKVTASTGVISTVTGNGTPAFGGDGNAANLANIYYPNSVAVDGSRNIYIGDQSNNRIRKVTASTGVISTVAGNGTYNYGGDSGSATSANLRSPEGVAVDRLGNIFITDNGNHRIRKVTASTGIISTIAGNETWGYGGDDSAATSAKLNFPTGVAVDGLGNIYIADVGNHRIRKVNYSIDNNYISNSQSICAGSAPSSLIGSTPIGASGSYTYSWLSSTTSANAGFTVIASSNTKNYSPSILTQNTWFRRYVVSGTYTDTSAAVSITVNNALANNTITSASQSICSNSMPTPIIATTATGGNGTTYKYKWLKSTTSATTGFTNAGGNDSSQNFTSNELTQNTWFKRIVSSGVCNADSTNALMVTVNTAIDANTITGTAQTICSGSIPAPITATTATGGNGTTYSYKWLKSITSATTGFTNAGGNDSTQNFNSSALTQNTWFKRKVTSGVCNADTTTAILVTMNNAITTNTITGTTQTICSGSIPATIVATIPTGGNGTSYKYKWLKSITSASTGYANAGGNDSIQNFISNALTQNTWFKRRVLSGVCTDTTMSLMVSVNPAIATNTITGAAQTICSGSIPLPISATTATGGNSKTYNYKWLKSTTSATAGFANVGGIDSTQNFTSNALTQNTWFKRRVSSGVCTDTTVALLVTVNPIPSTSNITGLTNVARLDTTSYSVTGTSGSVFNWVTTKGLVQTGAGTNQIQVKWNAIGMDTLKVTETSNQGCVGAQKILLVNIGPATGINKINTSNSILVYPNPFNETTYISLLNNSGLNKAILYDLLGKEILTTHKSEIDVKDLKSGVYLIMVIDNNGNSYSQKLMKN